MANGLFSRIGARAYLRGVTRQCRNCPDLLVIAVSNPHAKIWENEL